MVSDMHSLGARVAAGVALCFGVLSGLTHVAVLLGFVQAPWSWDLLFPAAFGSLIVSGLIAAWRGRDVPILRRYDASIQGWRPWALRSARLSAAYSVACFLAFIVVRVRTHGEMAASYSQAIAASNSAAFFVIAAMIFSASPRPTRK